MTADRLRRLSLVAAWQPHDLPGGAGRDQTQPDVLLHLLLQPGGQCQTPADPTLVPAQPGRDLGLLQALVVVQTFDDPSLLQRGEPPPSGVGPGHGGQCLGAAQREHRHRYPLPPLRFKPSQSLEAVPEYQHPRLHRVAGHQRRESNRDAEPIRQRAADGSLSREPKAL